MKFAQLIGAHLGFISGFTRSISVGNLSTNHNADQTLPKKNSGTIQKRATPMFSSKAAMIIAIKIKPR